MVFDQKINSPKITQPPVTGYTMEDLDGKRNSQVFIELQKPDKVGEAIFSQGQESVENQRKNVSNIVLV